MQLLCAENQEVDARWCCYGDEFKEHIGEWSDKCLNKIIDYSEGVEYVKSCDIIVCNIIISEKSPFFNINNLRLISKESCRIISIPPMYYIKENHDSCINELKNRESIITGEYIPISTIYETHVQQQLSLTCLHPTSFLFMEVFKVLCDKLCIPFFNDSIYQEIISDINYTGLP